MLIRLTAAITLCWALFGQSAAAQSPRVLRIDIDHVIHPLTAEIVHDAVARAEQDHAAALLIRLNTPGGLLSATEEIIQEIVASKVPVVTWVGPSGGKAASAGFMILIAGDVASMAPGTNTGAAHPVLMGGAQMDDVMKAKVENDAAASVRAVSDKRGRNSELAQEAVLESKAFTEQEALDENLIDLIAPTEQDLLAQLDNRTIKRFNGEEEVLKLTGAQLYDMELSYRQRLLLPLTDPSVAFILLILGLVGLYVEFSNPGLIFPGVFGGLSVIVGMMALSLLPINWAGAALIVLGIGCFVAEAFTVTHGVLAVGGAVSMTLGAVMLIDTEIPELSIGWAPAVAVTAPFAGITVFLLRLAIRSFNLKVETGSEGMIGEIGTAKTEIGESGQIFVHGEFWSAHAAPSIPVGAKVRVVEINGLHLKVEAANPPTDKGSESWT